jgi:hypothetical protein
VICDGPGSTKCDAIAGVPGLEELCDAVPLGVVAVDEDCDGSSNEGCPCVAGQIQTCGTDEGECTKGTQECNNKGVFGDCSELGEGDVEEQCDKLDNDCDGKTDETWPLLGQACDGDDSDFCLKGTLTCKQDGSGTECVNENPTNIVEICDGKDNDCDGATDEDWPILRQACDGTDTDKCLNGTYTCKLDGLGTECVNENPTNIVEICDGKDNDCDTAIDEDDVCTCSCKDQDNDGQYPVDCNDSRCTDKPKTDCCDTDPRARKGQTDYFDSPRIDCGGYDFDCSDGTEEKRWKTEGRCCGVVCGTQIVDSFFCGCPPSRNCSDIACGISARWVSGCGDWDYCVEQPENIADVGYYKKQECH